MNSLGNYELTILALGGIGLGIFLLVKGGDWTIEAAEWIALKSGLSKLFIAATIIAFGTSAPELFTSINANLSGYPGISLGNVLGSNIANVLMVLGMSAIIMPVLIDRSRLRIDTGMMIIATIFLTIGIYLGIFNRISGLLMFLVLIGYIVFQYRSDRLGDEDMDEIPEFGSKSKAIFTLFIGLGALVLGSELLVQGAVAGGKAIGVREAVIGMTVVAFGTSLPELSTCVAAARRGQSDMILGGLIGSNIFNILSIVALTALIKPLVADSAFLSIDLPSVIIVTLTFSLFLLLAKQINKMVGLTFVIAYILFFFIQYQDLIWV